MCMVLYRTDLVKIPLIIFFDTCTNPIPRERGCVLVTVNVGLCRSRCHAHLRFLRMPYGVQAMKDHYPARSVNASVPFGVETHTLELQLSVPLLGFTTFLLKHRLRRTPIGTHTSKDCIVMSIRWLPVVICMHAHMYNDI